MPILRRLTLVAATVALVLGAAAPASADTRGFDVCNLSSGTVHIDRLKGFDGPGAGAPAVGTLLPPLACHHFEVYWQGLQVIDAEVTYFASPPDSERSPLNTVAKLTVGAFGETYTRCNHPEFPGCEASPARKPNSNTIQIVDPPGTVVDVPTAQQAGILQALCETDIRWAGVDCQFTPTSETKVDSPVHQVGYAIVNDTDEDQKTSIETSDTVSETNSLEVGIKVEAKFGKVVEAAIHATYGHEWTTEHEFKQTVDVKCPPHHRCWIMATNPMLRDKGDFTITLHNTTWHLRGVYFDTPDPHGTGAYDVKSAALPPAAQASRPDTFRAPDRMRDTYRLPRAVTARAIASPRLLLSVVHSADQPTRHRIVLTRTHPAGRLVHRVGKVRVTATVGSPHAPRWHQVRRWSFARLAPFGRRDGLQLTASPPSAARKRTCVTVEATAPHARPDRARHCHRLAGGG